MAVRSPKGESRPSRTRTSDARVVSLPRSIRQVYGTVASWPDVNALFHHYFDLTWLDAAAFEACKDQARREACRSR